MRYLLLLTLIGCMKANKPPTFAESSLAAEIQVCVGMSKTQIEYDKCETATMDKYNVPAEKRK